jgi:tripartite-type tricarboxylate transporter receptor subunit TctC
VAIARLVNPASVKYDAQKDLAPIGLVNTAPMVIVARPGCRRRHLAEVIQRRAQPGKLSYGTSGDRHRAAARDGADQGAGQGRHRTCPTAAARRS